MANKVYENSQLICKYFKDAGNHIAHNKPVDAAEQIYSVQLFLHRMYIGHHHAVTSNTDWYHVPR